MSRTFVFALLLFTRSAAAKVVERVAAVVNHEIVLLSEVEDRARPMMAEIQEQGSGRERAIARLERETLERIVDETLIAQEASRLQIAVTPDEVDRTVDSVKAQNKISQDQLIEALRASGMGYEQYLEELKRQILRMKVLNVQVRSRVSVTDDEVRRYYDQNLRRAGADVRVRFRQIFVQIPENAPRALVRERKKRAEALAVRVRGGEDFGQIARLESDDLLSRADGGEPGWTGRGVLPPELEEIMFALEPNDLRGPVYTDRGAYIVELLERKASAARPFDEIKEELRAQMAQEETERATRVWLVDVRRRAYVDIRLAQGTR